MHQVYTCAETNISRRYTVGFFTAGVAHIHGRCSAIGRAILMEDAVYEFTQGYMEEIELQVVVGIKLHMEVVVSQRGGDYVLGG